MSENNVKPVKKSAPMSAAAMLEKLRADREKMLADIAMQEKEIAERAKAEEAERVEKLNALMVATFEKAEKLGVADNATFGLMVRNWVKNGTVALSTSPSAPSLNDGKYGRGQTIPEAEKENARALIREALANGKPLSEVAKATGIGYGSIFTWSKAIKAEMEAAKVAAVPPAETATQS